ncbi:MAG TPA: ABC transporter ATP-binding protein [Acidimicrobiales bacterium]|nr:ABC transporter ATP-binding protein [Acidimicrobiales bacterium]
MPSLNISELTKRYRTTDALDGVSFTARAGVCGLLGPNGAGKTTLLRIIATTLAADRGTVDFEGLDPADANQRVDLRRRLGYVPQEPGYHPSFTAFAYVDYIAILKEHVDRRSRHDEVRRVLDLVDLSDVAHRKMRRLSGGMRQRVALAQSLLGNPDLLVLDEPTAGLDPEQRLRFRGLVSRLAADRVVLLATHLTEDVEALCDQVVVLSDGQVRFDGGVPALAGVAEGRVWRSPEANPSGVLSWRMGDGTHRHIGSPPDQADLLPPTVEDGYLLLLDERSPNAAEPSSPGRALP